MRNPIQRPALRAAVLRPAILAASLAAAWTVAGPWAARAEDPPAARTHPAERRIAAIEESLERLAALERRWREADGADRQAAAERSQAVAALAASLAEAEPGSAAAGEVFDRSKELAREAVAELEAALGRARAPAEIPPCPRREGERLEAFSAAETPPAGAAPADAESARLEELAGQCAARAAELEALGHELRQAALDRHGAYAGRLWRLRLAALEALPAERRDLLTSWTRERWAEIRFDFGVALLVVEMQWYRLRTLIVGLPRLVRDVFAALAVGRVLLRLLLLALAWRWVQRRRPRVIELLRQRAGGRAQVAVDLVAAAAPWGLFLLGLLALDRAVGPQLRQLPLLGPPLILAAIYGVYRCAADLGTAVLVAGAERTAFEVTAERLPRIDRSVRRVLRLALGVFLLPAIFAYRLEGGVLYDALCEVAGWTVIAAVLVELVRWRQELADACLATRASGRWAGLLRRTRDRGLGILLAPLSFLWLAGRALGSLGHEIASGHHQARLATAYLARRRIEKEAQARGYADVDLDRLPAGLAEALDERLRPGDDDARDTVPGLDDARRAVAAWRRGEGGGAFLLAGEQGIGKRAWLDRFCDHEPVAARLTLDHRLLAPPELYAWLGRGILGPEEPATGRAELVARLAAGSRRIVVLEGAENLFLARVGGYRALTEMAALAGETRLEVFWLVAMEGLAFDHLRATSKELTAFGRVTVLPPWQPPQIGELLRRRLAAGGFAASYAELLGELGAGEDQAARARGGEQAYLSLLSDFAGGNPRVALHYFLRSLVPANGRETQAGEAALKVRPFRPPNESGLAEMSDEAWFLLAAVARHGRLTLEEASAVTAYRPALAGILFGRLSDLGVLANRGDRYRVATPWQPTAFRLLRRRNVLVSGSVP